MLCIGCVSIVLWDILLCAVKWNCQNIRLSKVRQSDFECIFLEICAQRNCIVVRVILYIHWGFFLVIILSSVPFKNIKFSLI